MCRIFLGKKDFTVKNYNYPDDVIDIAKDRIANVFQNEFKNNGNKPFKIGLSLEALKNRMDRNGKQKRFFKVFAGKDDITASMAVLTNENLSNARDTKDTFIVTGCGMDMGIDLLNSCIVPALRKYDLDKYVSTLDYELVENKVEKNKRMMAMYAHAGNR